MNTNPYEAPSYIEPIQVDPLRVPGIACRVIGVLGLLWAAILCVLACVEYRMVQQGEYWTEYPGWELARDATTLTSVSLLTLGAAWAIHTRRHRWLVIAAGCVGVLTCFGAPFAVVLLMRVWRKEVWNSFGAKANEDREVS
jgi:hypothetical protein